MATLIDVLDENGVPTGEKRTKQEIHEGGFWHNAAWVWIYNLMEKFFCSFVQK